MIDETPVVLSLFRMRARRFADDLRTTALAELLDERLLAGHAPHSVTLAAVNVFLDTVRAGDLPQLPVDPGELAEREDLDLTAALATRHAHAAAVASGRLADLAVFIVGAPRSGTSHLFNLLAAHPGFAYFTNVSCWAWPTYGLVVTSKRPCPPSLVAMGDSKRLKVDPEWLLPDEAEDVFARAVPVYQHLGRHTYRLRPATVADPALLHRAIGGHLTHFDARWFLAKTPFNTFRIPQLVELFGSACRFLHLHRDGYQTATSIAANRFAYQQTNHPDTPTGAWAAHVHAALDHADEVPMLHVDYAPLAADPDASLRRITEWLGIPRLPAPPPPRIRSTPRTSVMRDPIVENLHTRLAALHPQ